MNNNATEVDIINGQCCKQEVNCPLFLAGEFGISYGGQTPSSRGVISDQCKNVPVSNLPQCNTITSPPNNPTPAATTSTGSSTGSNNPTPAATTSTITIKKDINGGGIPIGNPALEVETGLSSIQSFEIVSANFLGKSIGTGVANIHKVSENEYILYATNNGGYLKMIQVDIRIKSNSKISIKLTGAKYKQTTQTNMNYTDDWSHTNTLISVNTDTNTTHGYGLYNVTLKFTGSPSGSNNPTQPATGSSCDLFENKLGSEANDLCECHRLAYSTGTLNAAIFQNGTNCFDLLNDCVGHNNLKCKEFEGLVSQLNIPNNPQPNNSPQASSGILGNLLTGPAIVPVNQISIGSNNPTISPFALITIDCGSESVNSLPSNVNRSGGT